MFRPPDKGGGAKRGGVSIYEQRRQTRFIRKGANPPLAKAARSPLIRGAAKPSRRDLLCFLAFGVDHFRERASEMRERTVGSNGVELKVGIRIEHFLLSLDDVIVFHEALDHA